MIRSLAVVLALLAQDAKAERGATKWIVETAVKGSLTAGFTGQSYPFEYEGWTTLTSEEAAALAKEGDVAEDLAKRLARAFAEPKPASNKKDERKDPKAADPATDDTLSAVSFTIREGKIKGKLTLVHAEGPGTRKIVAEVSGTVGKDGVTLKLDTAKATGTWDWGGGKADLEGKIDKHDASTRAPKSKEY